MTIRKIKGTVTPEPIINQKGHCSLQLPNVIALGVKPLGRSPKAGKTSRSLSLSVARSLAKGQWKMMFGAPIQNCHFFNRFNLQKILKFNLHSSIVASITHNFSSK